MSKKPKASKIDQAFTGSDKHTLGDLKLLPWTPERRIKAQEIEMTYPNLSAAHREQLRTINLYAGVVKDVSIFVYLSTLADYDSATKQAAIAFGVKRGFHNTESDEFWDAYKVFIDVNNEIRAAATTPKGSGEDDEDEDDPND